MQRYVGDVLRRPLIRSALAVLTAGVMLTAAGCGNGKLDPRSDDPSAGGEFGVGPHDDQQDGLGNGTPDPDRSGNPNEGPGANGQNDNGSPGTKNSPYNGPVIVTFRVSKQPQCPQGTNVNYVPGVDAVVEWKVTNADTVELAVDGPGLYGRYGLTGSQQLGFGCGGAAPNTYVKHTYLLTARKGGQSTSKTITAQAKVYDIGQVPLPPSPSTSAKK